MIDIKQTEKKLTRRTLLSGAATLAGAAVASPLVPSAMAAPVVVAPKAGFHPIVASASKNIVETESGKIYGYSRDGVIGYRGIPYAGNTEKAGRFMPPGKVTPWAGVRSALYWGWCSPQSLNSTVEGRRSSWVHDDESFMFEWDDGQPSEDCLRLNVWTPGTDNKKRAVMFWIHGGGMIFGSDNELRSYDGENLARQEDVVVVSINHRLGVLGFLNLMEYGEQYAASPNVSMLDIIAALQWVKTNIANFEGDPDRVMIFGQSGGGSKVGTLMGMPSAKGLFHRASIQSGSGLRQYSMETSARLAHETLAELGVSKDSIGKLHTDYTFEQIVRGLAGEDQQDRVADRRHVGLHLVGEEGAVDLEDDADLRVAVDVAVGQVDDERLERQERRRMRRVVLGSGAGARVRRRGLVVGAGVRVRRLGPEQQHRAAGGERQHQQHQHADHDQRLLLAARGNGHDGLDRWGCGSGSGHRHSFRA